MICALTFSSVIDERVSREALRVVRRISKFVSTKRHNEGDKAQIQVEKEAEHLLDEICWDQIQVLLSLAKRNGN